MPHKPYVTSRPEAPYTPKWPAQIEPVTAWRQQVQCYNEWSVNQFISADIDTLVANRAEFFDSLLQELWLQFKFPSENYALLAVGGYGRGALHPESDIDLLFLVEGPLPTRQQERISQFITLLWDLRLQVGHSVRTVAECMEQAESDITVATSLIEHRLVAGSEELTELLEQQINFHFPWSSRAFYQAKKSEQNARHRQFHGTAYNLEPNIKSSPGGLRDIQTISWIAKQHFHAKSDESLVEYNYITADEFVELKECTSFLWRIRFALHLSAQKSEDRLLFDYQPDVAKLLGYNHENSKVAVEQMMKDYFKVVLRVGELNRMLLQFFEQAILGPMKLLNPQPLDDDFALIGNQIMARSDNAFNDPTCIMRFFWLIAEHPEIEGVHSHTIRLLRNARRELEQPLINEAACRECFLEIIRHPRGFGLAFELMHRFSIMAHYLPAWNNIVGQMQFDLFHAYTVDEHTYRLLCNLYQFTLPEESEHYPLASEIVQDMQAPEWLFLAGIFHDIAKGRGGDHSELGAVDAREFAALHKLPEEGAELIAWLVEKHLLMSVTAQKRDIYDPEVIGKFASECGTIQRLNYLYCLTVADIRATNSNLWNNWKATLLEELYRATYESLQQHDKKTFDVRERVQNNRQLAMGYLLSAGFEVEQINQLWGRFTADYFFRHTPEQIAWHSQNIMHVQEHQLPLVLIGDENNNGTTELFIYHHEESHLFAKVAAVLDSEQLSIHDAQILNTRDGYVMDTFIVLQRDGLPLADAQRIEEVHQHLHDVLRKRRPVPSSQRSISRRLRNFKVRTRVKFINLKNARRSTFELITLDRPGLIARLAAVFQQLDINLMAAKITTVGEQAEDLFIVASNNQEALTESEREALKTAIITALTDE
ncbi:[protein-PII] uridylyltransferase [Aliidiomarina shirensis]|uniref:Bifunctional uridylyltransferase/uridylyl-removing enzyme n=1 Tax=Aliidiomarina shirensis TaxID=1048642 RepID=A0A432WWN3_9GAMM|nr:[protein-PII] uridylyltransferase [Aliidiomarina shirensis]RUO38200.1 [protein-PII] uridylyltransferase [Aliidiomarina shirensis]